jgi:branched-chain amino acid transport system permease protein
VTVHTQTAPVAPELSVTVERAGRRVPWRPSAAGIAGRAVVFLAFAWVVLAVPTGSSDIVRHAILAAIYALVGLSLNILIGYTGQLSLGHQGFLGAGALTAAYVQTVLGQPFVVALAGSVVLGALVALLLGFVALRITGLYLALITLVFGLTLQDSLFQVPGLTNGGAGQPADRPAFLADHNRFYLFCLALVVVILYVDRRLTASKAGRALLAIKENERVAAAFGINVTFYKLVGFVLSGAIAGLAGGVFAYNSESFNGGDYDFLLALTFVLMTVVGGAGSRAGVVAAAAFFAFLDFALERLGWLHFLGEREQFAPEVIGALLLITTLIFQPRGMATGIDPIVRWVTGKRFDMHGHEAGPAAVEGSSVRA